MYQVKKVSGNIYVFGVSILPLSTILELDFGTVPTAWYFVFFYQILELFRQRGSVCFSIRFWNCSDSVVVFVFLLDFGTVPTAWYFLFFYQILELFRQRGIFCFSIIFWNCSDSVVFFVFLLDFGNVSAAQTDLHCHHQHLHVIQSAS